MVEGDGLIYNDFKEQILGGIHDIANGGDTINVALVSGYVPNIDTDQVWADVSANDYGTSLGYTAGGEVLGSQAVTQDDANDRAVFDGADVTWTSLGPLTPATPTDCVMYNFTQTTPVKPLIASWEIATATNGGDYTIQWSQTPSAIILLT